ncbi:MAG: DNA recombination/repair protein RecA, partial [Trueperaceae bacterium]
MVNNDKERALATALTTIEKQYGKGAIMRLGDEGGVLDLGVISTGSLSVDLALGIGGVPRGRV